MRPNPYLVLLLLLLLTSACSADLSHSSTATPKVAAPADPPTMPSATATETVFPRPVFPSCEPHPAPPLDGSAQATIIPRLSGVQAAPTLRTLAEARGLYVGAATDPAYLRRSEHADLLARQFNMLAVENAMKWEVIHPEPERYDFAAGDALVAFAQANHMAVYAHVLVWELQQPTWLTESERSREEWIRILCQHIKTVVGHYRGQIYAWDVVNEAFDDQGALRNTHWLRAIGPEYIPMAFQWAREADPDALLIYNDFSA